MKYLRILVSSILSGVAIGIGGTAFLMMKSTSPALGAFLFSIGLTVIILLGLHLYTGKIGYVLEEKTGAFCLLLLVTYIGNYIGATIVGQLLRLTRGNLIEVAEAVAKVKYEDSFLSLLILGFFCGILIFLAVEVQKYDFHPVFKLFLIVMAIMVFILCGFEHCVADMFYFSLSNAFTGKAFLALLAISLGNSLGSIFFWFLLRFYQVRLKK